MLNTVSVETKKDLQKQIQKLSDYSHRDPLKPYFTVETLKNLKAHASVNTRKNEKQPREFTKFVIARAKNTKNVCVRGRRVHMVKRGRWVPHPSGPLFWLELREDTWSQFCNEYRDSVFKRAGHCAADYRYEDDWPPELKRYEKIWRTNHQIPHEKIPLRKFKVDFTMNLPLNNVTVRKVMS